MSTRRSFRWKLSLLAIFILSLAFLVVVGSRDGTSLTKSAKLVAELGEDEHWLWLNDDRLLIVENPIHSGTASVSVISSPGGIRRPLKALNGTLSRLGEWPRIQPSPNGKWLVAVPWKKFPDVHFLIEMATGKVVAKRRSGPFLSWLPNSKGWLAHRVKFRGGLHVLTVDGRSESRKFAATNTTEIDLGYDLSDTYATAWYDPYSRADLRLRGLDLLQGRVVWQRSVPLPPGVLLSEVNVSRDHDLIVWQTRPGLAALEWLYSLLQRPSANALWISRIDGSEMRNVGEAEVEYGYDYDCDLTGVQWLPDGKRIGFTYRNRLYVLGVI